MGRGVAVVLFTDLVGSTELRGRLGEEATEELRRRHDQLLAQAVEANNGRVVKGLGDGIMATFAGAADALAAAVAIQQAVDRLNRSGKTPMPLAVRVGLSAGDVTFEDEDVHGTPVIEAARLCAAAGGGEILAAEVVRILAGSTGGHDYAPVGPLGLKGLDHPVGAVRIGWEPLAVSMIPMPALLTDVGRIFVGRDTELEGLDQLWKEAAAGEWRVALLAGEPGVGKTRLAAEMAGRVHEEGGVVLAGRCDEDLGVPYQPFVEALRHFVDHTSSHELKERLGRYGGELARLIPELADTVPELPAPLHSDPETERYRLFDAVTAWLSAASMEDRVLLVLDDLHWAAKPTLLLLRHIVRDPHPKRLLILGTYRDTELTHDHPLVEVVADLRRQGAVGRLPLFGLDDLAVAAIVEQAVGQPLGEDGVALARAIYLETQGNPFFVREVLRHLAETKTIEQGDGGWQTRVSIEQLGIPEGVRDVIGRRLSRLSEDTNHVLRLAAVVGSEFEVDLVQTAGDFGESELLAALEEAVRARLLREVSASRFHFAHALVRTTLYESLTGPRRVALHRNVAQAIEAAHQGNLDDYLPALTHHWARAVGPSADIARAIDYATRAGDRALVQLAHDEAAAYYGQALELLGTTSTEPVRRLDLLRALGIAQRRSGDPAYRQTLLGAARLARELGEPERLADAALANNRGVWSYTMGVDVERVEMLEAALAAFPVGDSPTRAGLLARLGSELVFTRGDRHRALTGEALAMARRLGDRMTLADVLNARTGALTADPDLVDEALALSAELLTLAVELGDPALRAIAGYYRFGAAFQAGMVNEADRALDDQERAAAEAGQPLNRWYVLLCRAGRLLIAGNVTAAEAAMEAALELGLATGQPDARQFHAATRFDILFEIGALDQDVGRLTKAVQASRRPVLRAMLALAHSELDQDDVARRLLEPLVAELPALPRVGPWIRTVVPAAVVASRLREPVLARPVFELLRPYAPLMTGTHLGWYGTASHHLGTLAAALGQEDEAEGFLATAEATHASIPAPTWLARTRLEWARALITRRRPDDAHRARHLLGQALATARELGLAKVERDAVALLQ